MQHGRWLLVAASGQSNRTMQANPSYLRRKASPGEAGFLFSLNSNKHST